MKIGKRAEYVLNGLFCCPCCSTETDLQVRDGFIQQCERCGYYFSVTDYDKQFIEKLKNNEVKHYQYGEEIEKRYCQTGAGA